MKFKQEKQEKHVNGEKQPASQKNTGKHLNTQKIRDSNNLSLLIDNVFLQLCSETPDAIKKYIKLNDSVNKQQHQKEDNEIYTKKPPIQLQTRSSNSQISIQFSKSKSSQNEQNPSIQSQQYIQQCKSNHSNEEFRKTFKINKKTLSNNQDKCQVNLIKQINKNKPVSLRSIRSFDFSQSQSQSKQYEIKQWFLNTLIQIFKLLINFNQQLLACRNFVQKFQEEYSIQHKSLPQHIQKLKELIYSQKCQNIINNNKAQHIQFSVIKTVFQWKRQSIKKNGPLEKEINLNRSESQIQKIANQSFMKGHKQHQVTDRNQQIELLDNIYRKQFTIQQVKKELQTNSIQFVKAILSQSLNSQIFKFIDNHTVNTEMLRNIFDQISQIYTVEWQNKTINQIHKFNQQLKNIQSLNKQFFRYIQEDLKFSSKWTRIYQQKSQKQKGYSLKLQQLQQQQLVQSSLKKLVEYQWSQVTELQISFSEFNDQKWEILINNLKENFPNLKELNLYECDIVTVTQDQLNLLKQTQIKLINLDENPLSNISLDIIAKFKGQNANIAISTQFNGQYSK